MYAGDAAVATRQSVGCEDSASSTPRMLREFADMQRELVPAACLRLVNGRSTGGERLTRRFSLRTLVLTLRHRETGARRHAGGSG
jgi:hypothetical protein